MKGNNYFITADTTYKGLQEKVNEFIDMGYVPVGGVVIEAPHFLQTLVKCSVIRKWSNPASDIKQPQ